MSDSKHKYELLTQLTEEQITKAVKIVGHDGHTIFDIKKLLEAGWPDETAKAVCTEYESDTSDPRSTIFGKEGEVLPVLYGWYGLALLRSIASAFDVAYEPKMGRGFEAASIYTALSKRFKGLAVE